MSIIRFFFLHCRFAIICCYHIYLPGKSVPEGEFKIVEVTTFVSVTTIPHLVNTIPGVSCCVNCVLDNKGNDVTKEGKNGEGDKEKI